MSSVLVTGGTGVLGSRVAARLCARGFKVRVLSRREHARSDCADVARGELRSGRGLDEAVAGVAAVVHCASSPLWRARTTEVEGMRRLVAALEGTGAHLLYISIVGVDRIPYYYYRAKWEAEQVLESTEVPWTILRATQFHSLVERYALGPIVAVPKGTRAQLIDASEVAGRLVKLVEAGPSGRAPDIGGPKVLSVYDVTRLRREILGRRMKALELPAMGRAARAFRDGHNLCSDCAVGRITYAEYLRSLLAIPQGPSAGDLGS